MNSRPRLSAALSTAAAAALLAFAGCGGGGGSDNSSGADPAAAAPPDSSVFIEGSVRPSGDLKSSVEELVKNATNGQVDPGKQIIEAIDTGLANDPNSKGITYEDDIAPWLGEKAGIGLSNYDGQNFNDFTAAIQVTDSGAASDFFDKVKETGKDIGDEGSYNGYDYATSTSDGSVVGLGDDFFIVGKDLADFKAGVDAASGDSLASDSGFQKAGDAAPDGSLADVYVDVGALIQDSGASADPQVLSFYKALGVDFSNSTAYASVVPSSDKVEVDVATDATSGLSGSGDPSQLISSFPEDSFAAVASAGVGEQLKKTLDGINAVGFPPEVPKGALYSTLQQAGINVQKIASKIGDVGLFVNGSGLSDIGGALVVTTDSAKTAADTVGQFTALLRRAGGSSGVTILKNGKGFQIVDSSLPRPLVITSVGDRIVAGLGLPQTLKALSGGGGTLADDSTFGEAKDALGDANLSGFVKAAPILSLLQLSGDSSMSAAMPYLQNVAYLAFGGGTSGDFATSKIILALDK